MQIGYVFLARYAETNSDGTIDSIGSDFEIVRAPSFPAVFPIAVVIKLTNCGLADGDVSGNLPVVLDIVSASGASLLAEPFVGFLEPRKIPKSSSAVTSGSVRVLMNLGGVVFPEVGRYEVRLRFGVEPDAVTAVAEVTAEVPHV